MLLEAELARTVNGSILRRVMASNIDIQPAIATATVIDGQAGHDAMKPSEQLTDGQRKRVREIAEASAIQFGSKEGDMFILGGGAQEDIERAIIQALDEIIPQIVKRHDYSE